MNELNRRGFRLGLVEPRARVAPAEVDAIKARWARGGGVLLTDCITPLLADQQRAIGDSQQLYNAILAQRPLDDLLDQPAYRQAQFELLGGSVNQGVEQEIETVFFDALENGQTVAQDLWVKASWLSFYQDDASLRLRFSFGEDHLQDVAADPQRQHYAALLADAIFPESRLITDNRALLDLLQQIVGSPEFVERIVYFNAANGGAYFHHDLERGHAGVVYAQLSGQTYWLALAKDCLVDEISDFVTNCQQAERWPSSIEPTMQSELLALLDEPDRLAAELDSFNHTALIHLINETEEFVQQLIRQGYGYTLHTGDVILLPQTTMQHCCWHSVFHLGSAPGQALSFAMRV